MPRKKPPPKKRNPVVRELLAKPKRNAGKHQPKKPSRQDEKRIDDAEHS